MGIASLIEFLELLLLAALLFFTIRMVVQAYLKNGENSRATGIKSEHEKTFLPLKLQATERLILLLERMTPSQAVYRSLQPGMTALELQMTLIRNIREEFEHNVAQQIYISATGWALIRSAKEEVIRLINTAASETEPGAAASELARIVLEHWGQIKENPVQLAIDRVKLEIIS